MSSQKYFYGTGKRKSAIARVRLYSGNKPGGVTVNGKSLQMYPINWAKVGLQVVIK